MIRYFEGYLAKLADVRKRERKKKQPYSVVLLRAIHRKVFLKRTNYKTEQVERREKERERRE